MNIRKLKRSIYSRVRLRPIALSIESSGETVAYDDQWIVDTVSVSGTVELYNPSTGHVARLGSDHVHHFDSDPPSNMDGFDHGFLILTIQVFMRGCDLWLEPTRAVGRNGMNATAATRRAVGRNPYCALRRD